MEIKYRQVQLVHDAAACLKFPVQTAGGGQGVAGQGTGGLQEISVCTPGAARKNKDI